jgi:hypothetical protein
VLNQPAGNGHGFVGRIVENLDVEFLQRIIQAANGIQQPLDYELLVESRELDGYLRQVSKMARRITGAVLLVFEIKEN